MTSAGIPSFWNMIVWGFATLAMTSVFARCARTWLIPP